MKVLYSSTLYPPAIGGAQLHLHCLTRLVQAAGHEVHVATHTSRYRTDWLRMTTVLPEPKRQYTYEDISVSQLGYSPATRLRLAPWALAYYGALSPAVHRIAASIEPQLDQLPINPDLVHVSRNGREFLTQACMNYARRRGIPLVLTPNHHPRWRGRLYKEYDRLYREADAVVALTEAEKALMVEEKAIDPDKVFITGIGPILSDDFSAEEFRTRHKLDGPVVLYLGQQLKYKGVGALLQAAPAVLARHPDARFVFIGPPSKFASDLFAQVDDPRILNLGAVDGRTKASALAACDLLCLPSCQESFGGVFVEAWAHRKPVIGGRIPAIASLIDEGRDGLLASQSPEELADAVDWLLSNPGEREAMGQRGWEKYRSSYTWPRIMEKNLDVYRACGVNVDLPEPAVSSDDLEALTRF